MPYTMSFTTINSNIIVVQQSGYAMLCADMLSLYGTSKLFGNIAIIVFYTINTCIIITLYLIYIFLHGTCAVHTYTDKMHLRIFHLS